MSAAARPDTWCRRCHKDAYPTKDDAIARAVVRVANGSHPLHAYPVPGRPQARLAPDLRPDPTGASPPGKEPIMSRPRSQCDPCRRAMRQYSRNRHARAPSVHAGGPAGLGGTPGRQAARAAS